MRTLPELEPESRTFTLPTNIKQGLTGVAVLGFLSFFTSVGLFLLLNYRLIIWRRKSRGFNQFTVLIYNLLLADIQQSLAFLLNAHWVHVGKIHVETESCWAQGWFVSTGDLASGVFCLLIGIHTFMSVIMSYRPSPLLFYGSIIGGWVFVYGMAIIGVGMHPNDFYVRAGAWCWVNRKYSDLRLWSHYFWIFVAEFGNIIVYAAMYMILLHRIRTQHFSPSEASRAKAIANLMVAYPLVYVVCTLPLAAARMAGMSGNTPSLEVMCVAGAMITSNGWLDVLLYALTRRISIFSDEPPSEMSGLEAFQVPFWGQSQSRFGTTTKIEALANRNDKSNKSGPATTRALGSRTGSMDELFGVKGIVKTETTFQVRSDPVDIEDVTELQDMARRAHAPSSDSRSEEYKLVELERI